MFQLSVSSNGSTWVKRNGAPSLGERERPFSILERIDVRETSTPRAAPSCTEFPFSILERIDVGETPDDVGAIIAAIRAFSILERIDVGETRLPTNG